MSAPTEIWIQTNRHPGWIPQQQVTGWKWGHWRVPVNWTDEPDVTPGTMSDAGGSGVNGEGAGIPVYMSQPGNTNDTTGVPIKPVIPDSWAHAKPRFWWHVKFGLIVAIEGGTLPTVPDSWPVPRSAAATVTIDLTSNVFTATAHGLYSGDVVALHTTGALPTGVVTTDLYEVAKIGADTFRLLSNGVPVDVSGSQSGTHSFVLTTSVLPVVLPDAGLTNLELYDYEWDPVIATKNPYLKT